MFSNEFFNKNNIPIDKVLTSIYCRCFKTAEPISKDYEVSNMLVSIGRDDVKKKEIIEKYIDDNEKTQKYLNYFEKYCKFLRKNSFNNLTKDILTL